MPSVLEVRRYSSGSRRAIAAASSRGIRLGEHLSAGDEHHLHAVGNGVPRGVENLQIRVFPARLLGNLEAAQVAFGQPDIGEKKVDFARIVQESQSLYDATGRVCGVAQSLNDGLGQDE